LALFINTSKGLKLFPKDISFEEKRTFRLHLAYSIIEGFILGALALNEFVFIKSLKGSNLQLGILFQLSMVVFVLLIFVNEFVKRIKNRRTFLRWVGIVTRFPLLLLVFFPRTPETLEGASVYHLLFLLIFLIYYLAALFVNPTINLLLKNNYHGHNFSSLYSYATSINKIVMLVTTFFYGIYLDLDPFAFTVILPVSGCLGMVSIFFLSEIHFLQSEIDYQKTTFGKSLGGSIKNMYRILRDNPPYLHFEISFMIYGFSFMTTFALITIFFDDILNLNYSSVAFYKNAYNILAILLLPLFGRLMGKLDPRQFGVITYSALGLYLFFLAITEFFPFYTEVFGIKLYFTLIFYIIFHGFFAATMSLLWNIGSAYFANNNEVEIYQSTHLFLTGIRAITAPLSGIFLYEKFGFTITFAIAILVLLLAILVLLWSYRHDKIHISKA
jgi:hypothetical protein